MEMVSVTSVNLLAARRLWLLNRQQARAFQFVCWLKKLTSLYPFYSQYEITISIISDYKAVFDALNSEVILFQSLELGEIDFITYATELEYYFKAKDELLALEK